MVCLVVVDVECWCDCDCMCVEIFQVVIEYFVEYGYFGVWVDEIVEQMCIIKWMFYYYFGFKVGFYMEVLEWVYVQICVVEQDVDVEYFDFVVVICWLVELMFDYYEVYLDFICFVSIENIYCVEYMCVLGCFVDFNFLVIECILWIFECGCVVGVFICDVDVVDVYMMISVFCVFCVVNWYMWSMLFECDLFDLVLCEGYCVMFGDMVVDYFQG